MIKVLAASHGMQGMRQTGCIAKDCCVQTLCSVRAFDTSCSCAVEGDSVPLVRVQLQGVPLQLMAMAPLTRLCRHCPALLPEAPICRHIDAK